MASCPACGTTIFGGVKIDGNQYCNQKCASYANVLAAAKNVPQDIVDQQVDGVFNGACPKCGGSGPVDIRMNHKITSMLVITQWKTQAPICCVACGKRAQVSALVHCCLLGWWGIPNGLARTPFMIAKNLKALKANKSTEPSEDLKRHVRLTIAHQTPPPGATPYVRAPGAF
jgi:hypothetical protein